jgi:hypothetical protein
VDQQPAPWHAVYRVDLDESLEEQADARTSRAHHGSQFLLRDPGVDHQPGTLPEADLAGEVQEYSREPVLAVVGDQVRDQPLLLEQALSQVPDEFLPYARVFEQRKHPQFRDPPQDGRRQRRERLIPVLVAKGQLAHEIARAENTKQAILSGASRRDELDIAIFD